MSALHKDLNRCYFCEAEFKLDKYDMHTEEVGEFWNMEKQDSVLAHADCTPLGIDAILTEQDPVWRMA